MCSRSTTVTSSCLHFIQLGSSSPRVSQPAKAPHLFPTKLEHSCPPTSVPLVPRHRHRSSPTSTLLPHQWQIGALPGNNKASTEELRVPASGHTTTQSYTEPTGNHSAAPKPIEPSAEAAATAAAATTAVITGAAIGTPVSASPSSVDLLRRSTFGLSRLPARSVSASRLSISALSDSPTPASRSHPPSPSTSPRSSPPHSRAMSQCGSPTSKRPGGGAPSSSRASTTLTNRDARNRDNSGAESAGGGISGRLSGGGGAGGRVPYRCEVT